MMVNEKLHNRGICVVIPTYNNVGTIADVVRQTLAVCMDVIVVNDGSTDGTAAVLRSMAGITLVDYKRNRGKGYALKTGFRKALEMGFAYAITLDGDGQHYPHDIPRLLKANQQHPGALIVGRRNMTGVQRSRGSRFANGLSNVWFYVQTGCWLDDTQTGFRLYPLRKLHGLALLTARYEAELALLVMASWHGVRLVSVPVDVYYPPRGRRVSHFRPWRDFMRISLLNTVLCLLAVVYGWPLRLLRWLADVVRTVYSVLFVLFFSCCVITPAVCLYVRTGRMTEGKRRRLHGVIYHALRFVMIRHGIPGTRFTYRVSPKVSFGQPTVIISNHQSHLDLACQLIFTPRMVVLTNQWVWHNVLYGCLIRHAEFYPVADGIDALMPRLRSLVARGYSIAVYPEGTRSSDGSIGRFHQGAFYMAQELGLDITPMCLYGPGRILPKGTYWLNRGPIHVEVGDPIGREALRRMGDVRGQASAMRRYYVRWYEQLCNEMDRYV